MIEDSDAEAMEECARVPGHRRGLSCSSSTVPAATPWRRNEKRMFAGAMAMDASRVIVPHMAKSAATMICFGASRIHMGKTGELGPVDPQVPQHGDRGGLIWISADELLRSYDMLMASASRDPDVLRVDPYLQQLQRYDSRRIEQIRSARKLSRDISIKLLQMAQMRGQPESEIENAD